MAAKRQRDSESSTNDHREITSSSQLIYETVKGSHEFKIKRYSLAKGTGLGKFKTSGIFKVGGYDWVIRFYPDGAVDQDYISVYIELVSTGEVRASIELKLIDQSEKEKHCAQSQFTHTFTFGTAAAQR
ncbi:hypothetical protein MKW94_002213, partial [Papaver nudicaule]|nr:hypothetical protein [Papaver nudicaule]